MNTTTDNTENLIEINGKLIDATKDEYPCKDNCGACCRTIRCDKITKDNLCSIYETRPDDCRVEYLFEFMKGTNREEFYEKHLKICEHLRRNDGNI